ncbi:MAG: hypothetical protein SCH68_11400 [Brevefilum sp.]|nr:hypothetical protein [Brevefilum sp.]
MRERLRLLLERSGTPLGVGGSCPRSARYQGSSKHPGGGEDNVEFAVYGVDHVHDVRFDEIGIDPHPIRQLAGIMEGFGGDIDTGDACPQQRPGECVGPDVAQGVDQGLAFHLADLRADQVVQQWGAREQPVDVVVLVVDLCQGIPALLVGVGHVVHGGVLFHHSFEKILQVRSQMLVNIS